jgi:hypothetical protein
MRNYGRLGFGIGMLSLVAGLAACTAEPQRRPAWSVTAGTTGDMISPPTGEAGTTVVLDGIAGTSGFAGTTGFAGTGGGALCVDGKPVGGMAAGSMGLRPNLPATVTRATKPVPAISGGTLLALKDGKTAVAADPDRDRVYVVDLVANKVSWTVTLQAGDEPGRVVQDAAGRVHVALRRGGALVTIDPTTGAILARRDVCAAPRGVAYQATGDLLHVACTGGELVSLPAAGGNATRTLMLDPDLRDVVVGAGGQLLVSTFRRADVLVVGTDGSVGKRLRPVKSMGFSIFGTPRNMSPSVAWRMVPYNDTQGSVLVLHQMGVDDEINLSMSGYGGIKGCSAIVEAGTSVISPDGTAPAPAVSFEQVSLAVDVALSPDKSQIALAVAGNGSTSLPTLVAGPTTTVTNGPVNAGSPGSGTAMGGCVFLGGGAGSTAQMPLGEVVAVAYASDTLLLAQVRDSGTLWRSDTGAQITLSTEDRSDTGQLLFHVNAGGGLACASCHPEGGEDGRVWKFTCMGDRRTQSIRGKISGTAPFHWAGDETSFSTLMDDVFVRRMSGPILTDDQKSALSEWIDTIPAMPAVRGLDAAAVDRGRALFNDAKVACATCHAGALLTNNLTVDVGTGAMLQVPSLRGVDWRGPFMHNGCAKTLADRFKPECGGGDKHGATSQLSATQLADLTTYLKSL